ncbi:hypothetical protein GE061_014923 [Apolygus lucorum]|uniref:Uncharacterized protein n=1 Tax=Apolygus lucorum TaxID=248454 RepID=A0A8S9XLR2_APOLU|nr:hypothetical protein GE061_014923 [Apolygus lucorum]
MVTVYGDEEPATQEQATPIRFDASFEQPENLSLDQYIDAAVERAIRKLDAPVATMIRSFNATPDRHENMIIATPQRLNDTVMPAFVLGVPDETFIDPHDSPSNPRDVATPEPLDTTLTPETNKEDWYESYGWSTPAAVAPAPVPTTSSKEHTPRTPRGEASTQRGIPSELDRDMDADHNFDRSTERETERSEIPHGTDDPQTSRADRHETPLRHTKHQDESADRNATRNADRNADRNATRNADRNADRHKVRCTEEVNEDGEPIESSDEEFEEAKEDPPAKRLCEEIEETPSPPSAMVLSVSSRSYSPELPDCGIPLPSSSPPPRAQSRTGIFADSDWDHDEDPSSQPPPEPLPTPIREPQKRIEEDNMNRREEKIREEKRREEEEKRRMKREYKRKNNRKKEDKENKRKRREKENRREEKRREEKSNI